MINNKYPIHLEENDDDKLLKLDMLEIATSILVELNNCETLSTIYRRKIEDKVMQIIHDI